MSNLTNALADLADTASSFVEAATAKSTRRAYAGDQLRFAQWCELHNLTALPALPTTVGLYLSHLATSDNKASTIARALASIASMQRNAGHFWPKGHPAISSVMRGIRNTLGTAPQKKAPVMDKDLVKMVGTLGVDLIGIRDRAILTVGWFGAFRRSELVSLDVKDIRFTNDGVIVTLRSSKTDQEGRGYEKGLPYASTPAACPVRALKAWLESSGISSGAVFRAIDTKGNISPERMNDQTVARIIQRTAKRAGVTGDISGHSLRSGFITSAAAKGKSLESIMRTSGHHSDAIARGYIQHASIFQDNAAMGLL